MILVCLLAAHLLADFYFQTDRMAGEKRKKAAWGFVHAGVVLVIFLAVCFMLYRPGPAVLAALAIAGTHLIIDLSRSAWDRRHAKPTQRLASFVTDQLLHSGVLAAVWLMARPFAGGLGLRLACSPTVRGSVLILTLLLGLCKPTAILVRLLLDAVAGGKQAAAQTETAPDAKAGTVIGILERIIIAVLVLCGQYGAVGLVLTAKSVARFKQLEDRDFAEKYLIGTLTSLTVALIAAVAVKHVI